ncbi:GerW family sporulation protein [Gelria sp. Kuro-4]|uniref:GerW family sporulation protein n=1 Tax=Gelria sp. Kuro-4 TaxID=2796927 RepID=UPI001BEF9763|nr:spore germination protein GerW family protein [Gelria sp. Kuro-4]BCV23852.1 hypothetical protein kuro4_06250 [Gelria sp. Kuro-4]
MNIVKENLEAMTAELERFLTTKTVIGEPFTVGEVTLIPVMEASFGLGTGGGEGKDEKKGSGVGGGGGLGARLRPTGVVVIKGGEVSLLPLGGKGTLEKVVELVPELLAKVSLCHGQEKKEQETE